MIREEFNRLMKSKLSIIILILLLVSSVSFFMSYSEKQMFVEQLNNSLSADLNKTALTKFLTDYTGLKFLFDFWFNSDFSQLSMFILYVWAGIFLSPILIIQRENGFGNLTIIRKNYKYVALSIFGAQSLYIFVILSITTALQVLFSFILGGFSKSVVIGEYRLNFIFALLIILIQTITMALYTVIANGIALFLSTIIKNKYIIQALPLLVFALLPVLLSSTIGNLSTLFASFIIYFEPNNVVNAISNIFQSSFDITEIFYNIIPAIIYIIILIFLFIIDIKRNSRNYL
ncbi:MAG: hypothetical protein Q4E28_03010 [Clostridia bacterium]|nr:hypothetical protein [Clostridia bacterium]